MCVNNFAQSLHESKMAEYIYDPAFYISVSGTDPTCYSSYCCCSHCWHDRLQKAL